MAELINTGGLAVTKSSANVYKGYAVLLLTMDKAFDQLTTERMKIEIERANGNNYEVTKGFIPIRELVHLTSFNELITYTEEGKTQATIELTPMGAIFMNERDVMRVSLEGLNPANGYIIDGIEDAVSTNALLKFETKTILAEQTEKDFALYGYSHLCYQDTADITEIQATYNNGKVCKYSRREWNAFLRTMRPLPILSDDGTIARDDRQIVSLEYITNIQFTKNPGATLTLYLRSNA